jgi:signal peptidase I
MLRRSVKLLAAGVCLVLVSVASYWYLAGGRIYAAQTDSMRPTFTAGDAVLARHVDDSVLRPGMVVSYRDRSDPTVLLSHRIIQSDQFGLITKGDNNPESDLPIGRSAVDGQVYAVAPKLGALMQWLRTPVGLIVAVYIPAIVVVLVILLRLVKAGQGIYRLR